MVVGLPRSGTTWAANWLDAEATTCVHDPLYLRHYSEWDEAYGRHDMVAGVACTGIWRWTEWLNAHPARKLVLRRPLAEVNESMERIGLDPLTHADEARINEVDGWHVPCRDLFDPERARRVWEYLAGEGWFDPGRHARLVRMVVEPDMPRVLREADLELNQRLTAELGLG